jgi:hypothetical protein
MVTPADKLALGRRVADRLASAAGVTASFLAGSVVDGLGNDTSDIDLYLIGPGLAPGRRQLSADGTRIDVHELPADELAATADRAFGTRLTSDRPDPPVGERDLALLIRLSTADVRTGAAVLEPVRRRLADRASELRRIAITSWLTSAHADLEDLAGAVAGGDPDAAVLLARSALVAAGKAVAVSCGNLGLGRKWVWRQLDRSAPGSFPLGHFRFLHRADPDSADGPPLAEVLAFTQTCLAASATLGWQGVPLDRWPRWQAGPGPLLPAPGLRPMPYEDAVVLSVPAGRRVRLRPDVALVWGLCAGVDADSLGAEADRLRTEAAPYAGLDLVRSREILSRLVAAGLIVAAPRAAPRDHPRAAAIPASPGRDHT